MFIRWRRESTIYNISSISPNHHNLPAVAGEPNVCAAVIHAMRMINLRIVVSLLMAGYGIVHSQFSEFILYILSLLSQFSGNIRTLVINP